MHANYPKLHHKYCTLIASVACNAYIYIYDILLLTYISLLYMWYLRSILQYHSSVFVYEQYGGYLEWVITTEVPGCGRWEKGSCLSASTAVGADTGTLTKQHCRGWNEMKLSKYSLLRYTHTSSFVLRFLENWLPACSCTLHIYVHTVQRQTCIKAYYRHIEETCSNEYFSTIYNPVKFLCAVSKHSGWNRGFFGVEFFSTGSVCSDFRKD